MFKKITSRTNRGAFMRTEYGAGTGGRCAQCCNKQTGKHHEMVCIAFGDVPYLDCSWKDETPACALYNVPFETLRPRRMPLVAVYGPTPDTDPQPEEQLNLFGERTGGIHDLLLV